jgi:hypothetical protein
MIYFQPTAIGLTYRVFISMEAPQEVHAFFKKHSIWGGADDSGKNYLSYEIPKAHSWMQEDQAHSNSLCEEC